MQSPEERRIAEADARTVHWKRWGPYLSERQWGTVREDYSPNGAAWDYLPHDHARSRAYRWGEDGLLGISDNHQRLCFALALWNGRDPILKERLFGLSGSEGNHGEDVKEYYFYLDSTPTHSYMRALYKYPHAEFPYAALLRENRRRGRGEPELELIDTGVFDGDRYWDVQVEYAKAGAEDILVRVAATNRGPEVAALHVLPTLWFRNTWSWDVGAKRPRLSASARGDGYVTMDAEHPTLGARRLFCEGAPRLLFTENETNAERIFGTPNATPYVKDGIGEAIVGGRAGTVNPAEVGTKAAAHYRLDVPAGGTVALRLRLAARGAVGRPLRHRLRRHRRGATGGGRRVLRRHPARRPLRGLPARHAPGGRRPPVEQAVLPPRRPPLAGRRPRPAAAPGDPASGAQPSSGSTSTTKTSSPCRTSGNTRGTRPGISPST